MGVDPDRFYKLKRRDFNLMRRGYGEKLEYEMSLVRKATIIIGASCGAKVRDLEEAWPIKGREYFSIEDFRIRKAKHKLLVAEKNKKK